jgi:hypothetical protein
MNTRESVIDQCVDVAICHCVNAAATSAVATVGAPSWNEFLAPERSGAVAAFAGVQLNRRFVDELHISFLLSPSGGRIRNIAQNKKALRERRALAVAQLALCGQNADRLFACGTFDAEFDGPGNLCE